MATFTNQATLTYNGQTVNSNIVTGEITETITAQKAATTTDYRPGDIVTYSVSIQNTGTTPYNGLTVTDDLGEYTVGTITATPLTYTGEPVLYYVNGVPQAAPTTSTANGLTISGINIPAGGNALLFYRVRVNEFANPTTGSVITNTATIAGAGLSTAVTASAAVTANATASLTILKELSPNPVLENGILTYTFTIQNTGAAPADAAAGVVITDDFTPALEAPITVTINGATVTDTGNYTYNAATGLFTTTAGAVTVPAATYTQDSVTGAWTVVPGVTTVTVSGRI